MAGGGVGEAMLIGAAVGAGTGGIMSAAQDKDPLEGALLGAVMGAAGGGIGSAAGGALSGAATGASTGAATGTAGGVAGGVEGGVAGGTAGAGAGASLPMGMTSTIGSAYGSSAGLGSSVVPSAYGTVGSGLTAGTSAGAPTVAAGSAGATGGATGSAAPAWGAQGLGQGFAPALTNAQAYGAGAGGGIMGLIGNAQNQGEQWAPEEDPYSGSLSYFKYSPQTFTPSRAPGYADGGVASLGPQTGMYPQSQMPDRTQFAIPSQMPMSREVVGADYDERINPYTGDIMMASGGISNLGYYSDGGRMLKGPGDGMSDDIPGVIAGKQPARLADGEFVVPADVVSHLGNGSTDAGAKKLYSMMDSVRKARTGTKKQGKQIKAENYMPGAKSEKKASDGIAGYADGGKTTTQGYGTNKYYNQPYWQSQLANTQAQLPSFQQDLQEAQQGVERYMASQPVDRAVADANPQLNEWYKKYLGREIEGPIALGQTEQQIANSEEAGRWANNPLNQQLISAQGAYDTANQAMQQAQQNVSRLENTGIKYNPYTVANRPSSTEPQFYGNIYRGSTPDYSTPGYTLTGGNLGEWSNVAGEQARAAQPASVNQQVTQSYLQNLGRAPDTSGFNYWMDSGMTGPEIAGQMRVSPEGKRMAPGAVDAYYQQILGRNAEEGGMGYWGGMMSSGDVSPATVRQHIENSPESQVLQAYQDVLGRAPDQGGAAYWNQMAASGVPVSDIRQLMRESSEGFVNQAYQQNLGRRPDEGGLNYWKQMLNSNQVSRDDLNNLLSQSAESGDPNAWQRNSPKPQQSALISGTNYWTQQVPNQLITDNQVRQAYQGYLGRQPDAQGLQYWKDEIASGAATPDQLGYHFSGSPEAQINQSYQSGLGRAPDAEGARYWNHMMTQQGLDQGKINEMLLASPEHQQVFGYTVQPEQQKTEEKKRRGGITSLTRR